jgi:hypothetical protein
MRKPAKKSPPWRCARAARCSILIHLRTPCLDPQDFNKQIVERADLGGQQQESIASFANLMFQVPRGKYLIELYPRSVLSCPLFRLLC